MYCRQMVRSGSWDSGASAVGLREGEIRLSWDSPGQARGEGAENLDLRKGRWDLVLLGVWRMARTKARNEAVEGSGRGGGSLGSSREEDCVGGRCRAKLQRFLSSRVGVVESRGQPWAWQGVARRRGVQTVGDDLV